MEELKAAEMSEEGQAGLHPQAWGESLTLSHRFIRVSPLHAKRYALASIDACLTACCTREDV